MKTLANGGVPLSKLVDMVYRHARNVLRARCCNVQVADLKNQLSYIPKDRTIVTVSHHAVRGGVAGDILVAAGFKVAGAAGSEEYEEQGGTINRIVPPPRKQP